MRQRGFTLVELLITVAVVAILARIAVPMYSGYLARGKIVDALAGLSDLRVKMEQYFQDNRSWGTAGSACPVTAQPSQSFTYTCTVGAGAGSTYTATATSIAGAVGSGAGDYTYSVDETNAKATSRFRGSPVSRACWLIRGDEC